MYKLTYRWGNPLFLAALAILSAGMWVLFNAHSPANVLHGARFWFELPVAWLPSAFLCAIIPAALTTGSVALRITVGLTSVIFLAIYALIGVLIGDAGRFSPNTMFPTGPSFLNWSLHENWAQLTLAAVGGIVTTLALCRSVSTEVHAFRNVVAPEPAKQEDPKPAATVAEKPSAPEKVKEAEPEPAGLKSGGLGKSLGKEKEESGPGLSGLLDRLDPELQPGTASKTKSKNNTSPSIAKTSASSGSSAKASPAAKSSTPPTNSYGGTSTTATPKPSTTGSGTSSSSSASAPAASSTSAPSPTTTTTTSAASPASKATPGASDKKPTTPTSTATRLQAQKRKSTSTFTKLQALSASGTSGATARKPDSEESDSLKSILDRLDTRIDEYDDDILSPSESLMPLSDDEENQTHASLTNKPDSKSAVNRELESAARELEAQMREASLSPEPDLSGAPSLSAMLDAMDKPTTAKSTAESSAPPPPPSESSYSYKAEDLLAIKTPKVSTGGLSGLKDSKSVRSGKEFLKKDSGRSDDSSGQGGDLSDPEEGMLQESLMLLDEQLTSDTLQMSPDSIDAKSSETPSPTGAEATTESSTEPSSVSDPLDFAPDSAIEESLQVAGEAPSAASEIDSITQARKTSEESAVEIVAEATDTALSADATTVETEIASAEETPVAEAATDTSVTEVNAATETPAAEVAETTEVSSAEAAVTETPAAEATATTEAASAEAAATTEAPAAEPAVEAATVKAATTEIQAAEVAATETPAVEVAAAIEAVDADKTAADLSFASAASEIESNLFSTDPLNIEAPWVREFEATVDEEIIAVIETPEGLIGTEPQSENVFKSEVDQDVDDLFSSIVSDDAQKQVETESSAVEPAEAKAEPTEPEQQPTAALGSEVVEGQTEDKAESVENVFGGEIDKDIDDLFSSMVPEDAQKEVKDSGYSKAYGQGTEPSTEPLAEAESPEAKVSSTPETPISNVAAAEPVAAEEPVAATPEPAATAEPIATPEPAVAEPVAQAVDEEPAKADNVFGAEIDQDIDQLFNAIVPEDAQKEVKDSSYKAAYGEKVEPTEADNVSFTPPEAEPVAAETPALDAVSAETKVEETPTAVEKQQQPAPNQMGIIDPNLIKGQAGRFNQTLAHLPSLQGTVEGLLNNLASFETKDTKKPETAEATSQPSASDLIESFASIQEAEPAPEEQKTETPSKTALEATPSEELQPVAEINEPEPAVIEPVAEAPAEKPADEKPADEGPVAEAPPAVEAPAAETPEPVATPEAKATEPEVEAAVPVAEEEEKPTEAVKPAAEATPAEPVIAAEKSEPAEQKTFSAEPPKAEPKAAPAAAAPAADIRGKEIEAPPTVKSGPEIGQGLKDAEKVKQAATVEKQLKEFGRLSSKSAAPIESNAPPGTMKTIGKLLIEVQAVENIIKTGEETGKLGGNLQTARIITAARGEGIRALLSKIDEYGNIAGSVIVGHDGLVIASTLPAGMDKDTLGALSIACVGTSNLSTKKLEIGKLLQMVMITDKYISILTDVNVGILCVFMDSVAIDKIDGLLQNIHETVNGG